MESLVPILIGLAFVILQAISSGKKKETAQRRTASQYSSPQHNTTPQATFEERLKRLQLPILQEISQKMGNDGYEYPSNEASIMGENVYQSYQSQPLMQEPQPALHNLPVQLAATENENNVTSVISDEQWWDTENFDVRKAVIYSEIMRSKYI